MNARAALSAGQRTVQVDPPVQLRLHVAVHSNAQVEPDAHVPEPLSPIRTEQFAPLLQVYETLAPALTVQEA